MTDDDDPPGSDDAELPLHEQPIVAPEPGHKRREARVKREAREAQEFWAGCFGDPIGRRELWRLLAQLHPFEERFACGPNGFPQPDATWFHAGEQSFGLRLYHTWLRDHRAGVILMHDEHDPRFTKPAPKRTPKRDA